MPEAIDSVLALASSAATATPLALSDMDAVPEAVCLETAESCMAEPASISRLPQRCPPVTAGSRALASWYSRDLPVHLFVREAPREVLPLSGPPSK